MTNKQRLAINSIQAMRFFTRKNQTARRNTAKELKPGGRPILFQLETKSRTLLERNRKTNSDPQYTAEEPKRQTTKHDTYYPIAEIEVD